jgi:multicomponent Na+:H+ antiporter subunit F
MTIIALAGTIAGSLLLAAALVVIWRLVRGPTTGDRIVALELMSFIVLGASVCTAVVEDQALLLDVVVVIALMAFLGSVALAALAREER